MPNALQQGTRFFLDSSRRFFYYIFHTLVVEGEIQYFFLDIINLKKEKNVRIFMGEIIMRNSGNFEVIYQYFSTEITQFPETCYSPLLLYLQLFLSFLLLIIKSIYFYRFPHNQKTRILNKIK